MMRIGRWLALLPAMFTAAGWFLPGVASAVTAEDLKDNQCFVCHQEIEEKPLWSEDQLAGDIHLNEEILCQDCHGGDATSDDMEKSMDPEKGFVGSPGPTDVPDFCGKCHSDAAFMAKYNPSLPVDQLQKYHTSRHGERLAQGDTKVAQCVSCHGFHGMLPANNTTSPVYDVNIPLTCAKCHADPKYMKEYGIPTDQYEKYSRSVHGVALLQDYDTGSPACNDCHGNHGAVPPGVKSIAHVCSSCHARTSELFSESPHKAAFDANGWPECDQCHGNHDVRQPDDSMLGVTPPAVCVTCHKSTEDAGYTAAETMKQSIVTLADRMDQVQAELEIVKNLGMEVADIELSIRGIRQHLIQARALVHTVDPAQITQETSQGTEASKQAAEMAEAAISEYHFRRKGLGISTLIITFVAVVLYLKIRQIERRKNPQG